MYVLKELNRSEMESASLKVLNKTEEQLKKLHYKFYKLMYRYFLISSGLFFDAFIVDVHSNEFATYKRIKV